MTYKEINNVNLEDIVDICSSKRIYAKEYTTKGIPFYRSKEIIEKHKGSDISTELYINEDKYNELEYKFGVPHEGDILLTSVGTLGVPYLVENEKFYFKDGNLTWMRNFKKNCNNRFIYYWLQSDEAKKQIYAKAIGSTQKALTIETLKKFTISLPSLREQEFIVDIMSALDKKIKLNSEMNKTLEEMAQALFKRWFVDFEFPNEEGKPYKSSGGEMIESEMEMIPKGWRVETLQDISTIIMGVSPSSSSYNGDKIGLPLLNGAADFEGKLIKPSKYTSEPKKVCKLGDMVFGVRATIGNTVFADKEYALGRGVASVSPKSEVFREFIYYSLNNSMNKLIANASGSVFLNLKKADITDLNVCFSEGTIDKFNKIAKELINKIIENDKESEILKQQRDGLLPKLMSGEIRIDNIETDL